MVAQGKGKQAGEDQDEDDGAFVLRQQQGEGIGAFLGLEEVGAGLGQALLGLVRAQALRRSAQLGQQVSGGTAPKGLYRWLIHAEILSHEDESLTIFGDITLKNLRGEWFGPSTDRFNRKKTVGAAREPPLTN